MDKLKFSRKINYINIYIINLIRGQLFTNTLSVVTLYVTVNIIWARIWYTFRVIVLIVFEKARLRRVVGFGWRFD